jgi:hypothetical protein
VRAADELSSAGEMYGMLTTHKDRLNAELLTLINT